MTSPFSWTSAAITHVGNRRFSNEDAVLDRPDAGLWAVADGMGGHAKGDVASEAAIDALNRIDRADSLNDMVEAVEAGLAVVNQQLRDVAAEMNRMAIIGTTIVSLVCHGRHFVCLWAGDSRLYLLRDGRFFQFNEDHSRVQELLRAGLIDADEAARHPDSNIITRAIGVHDELFLDVDAGELHDGDRFLLCSDGLYRELDDGQIVDRLRSGSPQQVCEQLLHDVLLTEARDNVSINVVDVAASVDRRQAHS